MLARVVVRALAACLRGPRGPIAVGVGCYDGNQIAVESSSCGPVLTCRDGGKRPAVIAVFGGTGGLERAPKGCRVP